MSAIAPPGAVWLCADATPFWHASDMALSDFLSRMGAALVLAEPATAVASPTQAQSESALGPMDEHYESKPHHSVAYSATHGRGLIVGGSILMGIGGVPLTAGTVWLFIDIAMLRNCNHDMCGEFAFIGPAMVGLPGLVMVGAGAGLLAGGLKRRKLRGERRAAMSSSRWSLVPAVDRSYRGASMVIRF